jgi:hypothetical protein
MFNLATGDLVITVVIAGLILALVLALWLTSRDR